MRRGRLLRNQVPELSAHDPAQQKAPTQVPTRQSCDLVADRLRT